MSENSQFNLSPIHVVGAISIEAKQLSSLIDIAASKGSSIEMEAVKASIQRMVLLASAVVSTATPAEPPSGE